MTEPNSLLKLLIWIGNATYFAFRAAPHALTAIVRPGWWLPLSYGMIVGALPLAAVTGSALGLVIWIHTRDVLAKTAPGAVDYLPTFLSAAVLLELAPVGAGLIVAARTGASLGAELAAMRIAEQLDALQLLGVSPLRRLIGPRILAAILAVPLLYMVIATLAILSGYLAEVSINSTTFLRYEAATLLDLEFSDVIPAAAKTLIFGLIVGAIGCFIGLNARPGSEGVGKAATDSVVACSLFVLAADVFLVSASKAGQILLLR